MAPQRKRSGAGPRKVTVHHFAKLELGDSATASNTMPGIEPGELVTEMVNVPALLDDVTTTRPQRQRSAPPTSRRRSTGELLSDQVLFAHQLFEQQRIEEARLILEDVVKRGAKEAYPYTLLGTVYLALGRRDRALPLFEAALELDTQDVAARVYRGEIRLAEGRLQQARADLQQARKLANHDDPFGERADRLLRSAALRPRRSTHR